MKKKRFNVRSLKFSLLIVLIVVALFPVLILGTIAYNTSNRIITQEFHRSTSETLEEVNRSIDNYFLGLESYLNMLSTNINFTEIDLNSEREEYASKSLKDVVNSRKDITAVYMGRANKKLAMYPSANLPSDFDPTTRPWYKDAVDKNGDIAYTEPYKDEATGKLIISISKIVKNNGQFVGVVSIDISLDDLTNSLATGTIGSNGYIFISSSKGAMLAHPDSSLLGGNSVTTLSYWKNATSQESGYETFSYNGENNFINYTTNKKTGWKLMALLPVTELTSHTSAILETMLIVIIVICVVSIIVSILVSSRISSKLNKLINVFEKAADGDLTVKVSMNSKDEFEEVGNHFNMMIKNIGELISNVKISSNVIYKTSEDINNIAGQTNKSINDVALTIDQVAHGASETSQDIQTGVDAVNHLAGQIDIIDGHAKEMINMSQRSNSLGMEGLTSVNKLTEATKRNNKSSQEVEQVVKDMNDSTGQIGIITDTITAIASQTNLLALNAAIEAARAGEAGKGFSVVADEIRQLAEQSTSATNQIHALIENIKNKSKTAVKAIDEAKLIVTEQNQAVIDTKDIFNKILESVSEMINKIKLVQSAIEETNKGKEEIVARMQNISAVAEESSASAEEVSATTQEVEAAMNEFTNSALELQELSRKLEEQINKFKL